MIAILVAGVGSERVLNPRIVDDSRLSQSQRTTLRSIAVADDGARVEGLDARMRPVVLARAAGPGRRTRWALLRNGDPARVEMPMTEVWGGR